MYVHTYMPQVGTGFSFTDSEEGYSRNEDQVADNLYEYACYMIFNTI